MSTKNKEEVAVEAPAEGVAVIDNTAGEAVVEAAVNTEEYELTPGLVQVNYL